MEKILVTPLDFDTSTVEMFYGGTWKNKRTILKSEFYRSLHKDMKEEIDFCVKNKKPFSVWACRREFTEKFYEEKLKFFEPIDGYENRLYFEEDGKIYTFRNVETLARKARKEGKTLVTRSAFYGSATIEENIEIKEEPTYYILTVYDEDVSHYYFHINGEYINPGAENCPKYIKYIG